MAGSEYTIFYSWQSDLPSSNTRNLIQDSISAAVKALKNTVAVNADRDMKGVYGAPDIVQTILSKIDDCDLFVADVSAVTVYQPVDKDGNVVDRTKAAPNPNVLFELGYAVQSVGWDNIICIMNEDYTQGGEIPFDIEHNRLTKFSLKDRDKKEVCRELRDIIASTVLNVMENGKRVRSNFSNIKIGGFNFTNQQFESNLIPLNVHTSAAIQEAFTSLKESGRILVHTISEIVLSPVAEDATCVDSPRDSHSEPITLSDGTVLTPVHDSLKLDLFKKIPVQICEEEKVSMTESVKRIFCVEISENFFEFGGLKKRNEFGIQPTYELIGAEDEKEKYNKYIELGALIAQLELWEMFLKTFEGYILLPLVAMNESTVSDSEITVFIEINPDTADVVLPTEDIINPDLKGIEGHIYEIGVIKDTLMVGENATIRYDSDLSYSPKDTAYEWQAKMRGGGINGNPLYDAEDYARELSKYIAAPIEGSQSSFCFEISTLHANETKWLGKTILLKPKADHIEVKYTVKSKASDGSLSGVLSYSLE